MEKIEVKKILLGIEQDKNSFIINGDPIYAYMYYFTDTCLVVNPKAGCNWRYFRYNSIKTLNTLIGGVKEK